MTLWAKSTSCAALYQHYFANLISSGRVVIQSSKADSLAHTLRGVLRGYWERNEAPYAALHKHVKIKVEKDTVIMEKNIGSPSIEPIAGDERTYKCTASVKFTVVLSAVAHMIDGKVDKVAFLSVEDFSEENKKILAELCDSKSFTYSFANNQCVIVKG